MHPASWNHPRVHGEKAVDFQGYGTQQGLPPRARGKAGRGADCAPNPGITPACAGKSCTAGCVPRGNGDHPRVCGEKGMRQSTGRSQKGSPPRVRGKVSALSPPDQALGITPACAGKRKGRQGNHSFPGDHPRVCGEKRVIICKHCHPQGSPPRVRGKARMEVSAVGGLGITPACAGKR